MMKRASTASVVEKEMFFPGTRSIHGREFSTLGRLNLTVPVGVDPRELLTGAVTDWINTSADGQKLWREKNGAVNFDALVDAGVFYRDDFTKVMKLRGAKVASVDMVDPSLIMASNAVLVNAKHLIKFDVQLDADHGNNKGLNAEPNGFTFG